MGRCEGVGIKMSNFDDVVEFQKKFNIPMPESLRHIYYHNDLIGFRIRHLYEELEEVNTAFEEEDQVKLFDSLIDLVYVALGTAANIGLPWEEGWKIVHEANMKKVRSHAKIPGRSYFDVVKPEGWEPPDVQLAVLLLKKMGHK